MFGQTLVPLPDMETYVYIVLMIALGFGGQMFLNGGLQLGNAAKTTLMRNLDIVFAFIWQLLILQQKITGWSCVGATLIIICSGLSFLRTQQCNECMGRGDVDGQLISSKEVPPEEEEEEEEEEEVKLGDAMHVACGGEKNFVLATGNSGGDVHV